MPTPAVPAHLSHPVLSHTVKCGSVSSPSLGPGPCLAFLSALPVVRPRAASTPLAGSADCSQTALCTEKNIPGVTQEYRITGQCGLMPTLIICFSAVLRLCCYTDIYSLLGILVELTLFGPHTKLKSFNIFCVIVIADDGVMTRSCHALLNPCMPFAIFL